MTEIIRSEKGVKKTYSSFIKEVPEEVKNIFKVPRNMNRFLNLLLPNIKFSLYMRNTNPNHIEGIISEFVFMMWAPSQKGVPYYATYDPIKFPEIPYYKWFLKHISYAFKDFYTLLKKQEFREVFTVGFTREEICVPGTISENSEEFGISVDFLEKPKIREILGVLNKIKKNRPREAFAQNIIQVFLLKYKGFTSKDIADHLETTTTTVSVWLKKIQGIIKIYTELEFPEPKPVCAEDEIYQSLEQIPI